MFFGLLDPDPVVQFTDPDQAPDHSVPNQVKMVRKTLILTFYGFLMTFYL
jgi:hypothetical protein